MLSGLSVSKVSFETKFRVIFRAIFQPKGYLVNMIYFGRCLKMSLLGDLCGLDSGGSSSLKFDSHDSTTASMIQKPRYAILGVVLFRILLSS